MTGQDPHDPQDEHDRHNDATPEDDVGAAVDDALSDELKRQRARFVQAYIGVDRAEGVGRGEAHWNESLRREAGSPPDDD